MFKIRKVKDRESTMLKQLQEMDFKCWQAEQRQKEEEVFLGKP